MLNDWVLMPIPVAAHRSNLWFLKGSAILGYDQVLLQHLRFALGSVFWVFGAPPNIFMQSKFLRFGPQVSTASKSWISFVSLSHSPCNACFYVFLRYGPQNKNALRMWKQYRIKSSHVRVVVATICLHSYWNVEMQETGGITLSIATLT